MDVLSQALNVAEQAEAATGSVTLTFDLLNSSHRAAYAAALAVLRISGVDEDELIAGLEHVVPAAQPEEPVESGYTGPEGFEGELRKRYGDAMNDLSPDEARRAQAARETFPRVVELLKDGANVEAVAQIQYRRWVEENLDSVRG
ncbi:MAG TPA: hypothetical protein VFX49_15765 [Chloroflexota bacterium]|nr:hypothetical protein [Chloroflexota bacterium]